MAKVKQYGESKQGLIVTLVFFILASIGLGLAAYKGYEAAKKSKETVAAAEEAKLAAQTEIAWYRFQVVIYRGYLGEPVNVGDINDADAAFFNDNWKAFAEGRFGQKMPNNAKVRDLILTKLANDVTPWAGAGTQGNLDYKKLLQAERVKMRDLQTTAKTSAQEAEKNKGLLAIANQTIVDLEEKAYKPGIAGAVAEFAKSLAQDKAAIDELKKRQDQDIKALQDLIKTKDVQIGKLDQDKKDLQTALGQAKSDLADVTTKTGSDEQKAEAKEAGRGPEPKGEIVRVHSSLRRATINVGRDHGLTLGTTFAVFGRDSERRTPDGRPRPKLLPKAEVEVVELGDRVADIIIKTMFDPTDPGDGVRARRAIDVISLKNTDPVSTGDLLVNPIWNPNQKTHVALAGAIDFYGTSYINMTGVIRYLEKQNIVVDAYVDPIDGGIKGPGVTQKTNLVIIGLPLSTTDTSSPEQKTIAEAFNKSRDTLRDDGKKNGLRFIDSRRFLEESGFSVPRSVIRD